VVSARRRWATAATSLVVVAAAGLLIPSAASAADGGGLTATWSGDTLHVAWDGTPYTTSTESFVGEPVTVPGDRATRTLTVTNNGPSAGTLRAWIVDVELVDNQPPGVLGGAQGAFFHDLTLGWTSASQSSQASFAALAAANRTAILQTDLAQGATTQLTITYTLPITATSGNAADTGVKQVSFAVLLEIRGDEPSTGGGGGSLAATGAQVLGVLGVAGAAVATGMLLVLLSRRRRQTDPARAAPDAR